MGYKGSLGLKALGGLGLGLFRGVEGFAEGYIWFLDGLDRAFWVINAFKPLGFGLQAMTKYRIHV